MSYSYHDEDHVGSTKPASNTIWGRGVIMLLFIFCFGLGQSVLYALAVIQFIWMLIKGGRNEFIAEFGRSLAIWLGDVACFLTADSEEKPFPWRSWPTA